MVVVSVLADSETVVIDRVVWVENTVEIVFDEVDRVDEAVIVVVVISIAVGLALARKPAHVNHRPSFSPSYHPGPYLLQPSSRQESGSQHCQPPAARGTDTTLPQGVQLPYIPAQVAELLDFLLPSWAYVTSLPGAATTVVDLLVWCEDTACQQLPHHCRPMYDGAGVCWHLSPAL